MKTVAEFEKVSYQEFKNSFKGLGYIEDPDKLEYSLSEFYDKIKLPERKTSGSAGHDISTPLPISVPVGESLVVPTGLKCRMEEGYVMLIFPRSSLGIWFRMMLTNTVGVIDSDYYGAENEGHILISVTNNGNKTINIPNGARFAQAVFVPYGVAAGSGGAEKRTGGIGSTGG